MPQTTVNIIANVPLNLGADYIQAEAQNYFGSCHTVDVPYVAAGSQQYRFDVVTDNPAALKAAVAANKRYGLR
jgi:hypothetical protein